MILNMFKRGSKENEETVVEIKTQPGTEWDGPLCVEKLKLKYQEIGDKGSQFLMAEKGLTPELAIAKVTEWFTTLMTKINEAAGGILPQAATALDQLQLFRNPSTAATEAQAALTAAETELKNGTEAALAAKDDTINAAKTAKKTNAYKNRAYAMSRFLCSKFGNPEFEYRYAHSMALGNILAITFMSLLGLDVYMTFDAAMETSSPLKAGLQLGFVFVLMGIGGWMLMGGLKFRSRIRGAVQYFKTLHEEAKENEETAKLIAGMPAPSGAIPTEVKDKIFYGGIMCAVGTLFFCLLRSSIYNSLTNPKQINNLLIGTSVVFLSHVGFLIAKYFITVPLSKRDEKTYWQLVAKLAELDKDEDVVAEGAESTYNATINKLKTAYEQAVASLGASPIAAQQALAAYLPAATQYASLFQLIHNAHSDFCEAILEAMAKRSAEEAEAICNEDGSMQKKWELAIADANKSLGDSLVDPAFHTRAKAFLPAQLLKQAAAGLNPKDAEDIIAAAEAAHVSALITEDEDLIVHQAVPVLPEQPAKPKIVVNFGARKH